MIINGNIICDLKVSKDSNGIVIFCHGYKGFKDWGPWNLVAEYFVEHKLSFLKFNFSHNGGTLDDPIDFPDENAFGENTYSKEMEDLDHVISFVTRNFPEKELYLIGHSRGGGIATLKTGQDTRVSKLVTWASVSDFKARFPKGDNLEKWRSDGVMYILNGRTKQQLPHYISFYEDFVQNEAKLEILKWCTEIKVPHLIVHGTNDEAVSLEEAKLLMQKNPKAISFFLETNHTFDTKHPWLFNEMSNSLKKVSAETIRFLCGL